MTFSWATSLCAFLLLAPESIEMRFEQVAPVSRDASAFVRTPNEKRAVILIHGLLPHPINDAHVADGQPQRLGETRQHVGDDPGRRK